jgi:hypothetical protein
MGFVDCLVLALKSGKWDILNLSLLFSESQRALIDFKELISLGLNWAVSLVAVWMGAKQFHPRKEA